MNLDMNKVGNQIASLRKAKGLTQNELGERLGVSDFARISDEMLKNGIK